MPEIETDRLLESLRDAADRITQDRSIRDLETTLERLVGWAVEMVPKVEAGGISRTANGFVHSSHATHEEIAELDGLQSRLGQGPCISAANDTPSTGLIIAQDLAGADAERWPEFTPEAVAAGWRSMMSIGLTVHNTRHTALNLYARDPDVFDPSAQLTAGVFGLQASMLLHGADQAALLGVALESRDVIGQAKGILMERFKLDDNDAFAMLVSSSQDTNVKLVDVARWLVGEAVALAVHPPRRKDGNSNGNGNGNGNGTWTD